MIPSRLIEIFLQVIQINALSANEKPLADFINSFLTNLGYKVEFDDSAKFTQSNTGNLICKIGSGGDFVMTAHMDTARPTENVKPMIKEDRITSSGDTVLGVDNREGVAVLLYSLERIALEKIPVKDFTVAFTTCEETTLFGSKYLGLNGNIKKGFVFDSGYRPGSFIYSACGAIGFNLKIFGRASHSGIAPEKGINSLLIAANAITKLPLGRIDEETTMNIGTLKSGSAVNVIPELTEVVGEVRSFNLDKAENYFRQLVKTFEEEAEKLNAKIEYDYFWDFKPYTIKENSDVYKEILRAITKVGLVPSPKISLGGSDANSLNAKGIESVNIGIGAQNPHSNDEFVYIEDLIKSAEIALELVKKD
ncbi:Di- and tripeptidase [Ignavibacterium album JCM 16511]|uniref:Di-and tripeptidase n=1 Tax=Ignavibacterium album (strain DSM 19864 / JCM 16511 / NBRC 101810 / Mat9-16) TaxID=945713 RepID=I0ANQ8_IGNAJ|nr:M20/M25/M40 family metallo-hydrolase [Ignavibacterium album]AFH50615.1 Di- and tripeptidase [Ignavibacterium album JCM 16511]